MSRSRKKNPYHSWCVCHSEKDDKRKAHRRLRAKTRQMLHWHQFDTLPSIYEVSDRWNFGKDGKVRFNPDNRPEYLRK